MKFSVEKKIVLIILRSKIVTMMMIGNTIYHLISSMIMLDIGNHIYRVNIDG